MNWKKVCARHCLGETCVKFISAPLPAISAVQSLRVLPPEAILRGIIGVVGYILRKEYSRTQQGGRIENTNGSVERTKKDRWFTKRKIDHPWCLSGNKNLDLPEAGRPLERITNCPHYSLDRKLLSTEIEPFFRRPENVFFDENLFPTLSLDRSHDARTLYSEYIAHSSGTLFMALSSRFLQHHFVPFWVSDFFYRLSDFPFFYRKSRVTK